MTSQTPNTQNSSYKTYESLTPKQKFKKLNEIHFFGYKHGGQKKAINLQMADSKSNSSSNHFGINIAVVYVIRYVVSNPKYS